MVAASPITAWAEDYYDIDPHYGTKEDLKDLVDAVHEAGMLFVLDIVMNHMRPVHSDGGWEVEHIVPFNDKQYYNQLKPLDRPGGDDWDAYVSKYCNWPSPLQAQGPGALCYLNVTDGIPDYTNGNNYCNNYKGSPFGPQVFSPETYLGEAAAGPPEIKYCGPGNYCKGYSEENLWGGWFYDLGDLNQSHPFVRATQLEWIRQMHTNYSLDGIRLDTAPFMPWSFLKELQSAARPMQIIGEVTTSNISWHASFQQHSVYGPILAGMENFPPFNMATPGFCNDTGSLTAPEALGTLVPLGRVMHEQIAGGAYTNLGTLMNFVDQQDYAPVAGYCQHDAPRIRNSLVWAMLSYGMPVIQWGTEQGNDVYRNTLWTLGFSTSTWQYRFIRLLNAVRKRYNIAKAATEVIYATQNQLVFVRGDSQESGLWVFTNNLSTEGPVSYNMPVDDVGNTPWYHASSGEQAVFRDGQLIAPSRDPVILVPRKVYGPLEPVSGDSDSILF